MSEVLSDKDPFDENKDEEVAAVKNLITEKMVKKATYLIHKLADRRGADYKEIQKKCKKLLGYENLAKVTFEDGRKIIDKLVELTGGEEEQHGARVTDDGSEPQKIEEPKNVEKEIVVQSEDVVTATMRESIRAAVDITLKEVVHKEVPVQGLGGFVLEIGKVIFEAKMSEDGDQ